MNAAPTPAAARAAINHHGVDTNSGTAEASENNANPTISTARRP
ncbi:hypothetical protein WIMU106979_26225 [Williamsia muralis]